MADKGSKVKTPGAEHSPRVHGNPGFTGGQPKMRAPAGAHEGLHGPPCGRQRRSEGGSSRFESYRTFEG